MTDEQQRPTQKSRPKGKNKQTGQPFKPVEIPVPTRKEVDDLMRAVVYRPAPADDER